MNILILSPRLDVPFKNLGPISAHRGPIEPIRIHWQNFIEQQKKYFSNRGDKVIVIERPLWQFEPEETETLCDTYNIDRVLIPHRELSTFHIKNAEAFYYMQTVFPWRFYVDKFGYAGGSSLYGMDISDGNENGPWFDNLRAYALQGKSKFAQPKAGKWIGPEAFIAFTCQLPHDHTIKYHSKITVEDALIETCEATKEFNIPLVVKGHVISRDSMVPLKDIASRYKHTQWIEDVSIHDILSQARGIVTVNSGTGMEALLHKKPVATFGRAEYDVVTFKACKFETTELGLGGARKPIGDFLLDLPFDEIATKKMFDKWCNLTYDTNTEYNV